MRPRRWEIAAVLAALGVGVLVTKALGFPLGPMLVLAVALLTFAAMVEL